MKPLDQLLPDDLEPLVGQSFSVVQNEGDLRLELVAVRALPPHSRREKPFALLFRGPSQPVLQQRIHTLAHAELGTMAMFLVPVSGGQGSVEYEAIFN